MNTTKYHFVALFVLIVWGTAFVATKILIYHGLTAKDVFFYRFLLAFIFTCFFGKQDLFAKTVNDEIKLLLMGVAGGSFYFTMANIALEITHASNVALLSCIAPIFTVLFSHLFIKSEKLSRYFWQGTILALTGVIFVVFNGRFILQIRPMGDILSILAALSWAFYTILLDRKSVV